jgi:hypothetical protein
MVKRQGFGLVKWKWRREKWSWRAYRDEVLAQVRSLCDTVADPVHLFQDAHIRRGDMDCPVRVATDHCCVHVVGDDIVIPRVLGIRESRLPGVIPTISSHEPGEFFESSQ